MTSQVAVLNLHGVAVASDSVMTLGAGTKQRTISSMEKIFDLGTPHNVVIMINDSAQFMGVPWAPILNEWIATLKTPLVSIEQYWEHLRGWLPEQDAYFTPDQESLFVSEIVQAVYLEVRSELLEYVTDSQVDEEEWETAETGKYVNSIVNKAIEGFGEQLGYEGVSEASDKKYLSRFKDVIKAQYDYVFDDVPTTKSAEARLLNEVPTLAMARAQRATPQTEIAFIGYGTSEVYPSIERVRVEGVFNGRTRWWVLKSPVHMKAGTGTDSMIEGYAQSDAIFTFVKGMDPSYRWMIQNAITEVLDDHRHDLFNELDEDETEALEEEIHRRVTAAMDALEAQAFTAPILATVAAMPPLELARMAESLVGIQALRASSGNELPTVGGDIDVVVITRHSGVKWIKRQQHAH
jgi:hypothetical protein